jgi:flavin reductase (DIM6/NTAB) family NADH-FMN oxidoreductase RutF
MLSTSSRRQEISMVHSDYSQLNLFRFAELVREGALNAALFSEFVVISVTPSLLGFVPHESRNGLKDTVCDVLESEDYVINTVSERMAAQVQVYSETFPRSVSEVAEVGFYTLSSTLVRRSRITEAPVHFQCRLYRTAKFGREGSRTHLIVGEILAVHCSEGVRIAGRSYCRTEGKFDV